MGGGAGLVLGFIAVVFLQQAAAQTVHIVGDSTGWSVPQGNQAFYSDWAANKSFVVGDSLSFVFPAGAHDVLKINTQALFTACTFNSNDEDIQRTSPVMVQLDEPGTKYFVCTIGSHCSLGQKLSINVSATARGPTTPSSPMSPSPPQSPPSPPSPSSSNAVMASLYVTLLSAIVMSLF